MQRRMRVAASAAAAGTISMLGGVAQAETATQTRAFNFPLEEEPAGQEENALEFAGFENLTFDQFDPSDGRTLNSVKLEVETSIAGTLDVLEVNPEDNGSNVDYLEFSSMVQVADLQAEADFGDYVLGVDGSIRPGGRIAIDENGEGEASTSAVGDFLGTGSLNGLVSTSLEVDYGDGESSAGGAGPGGIFSDGEARLIYNFEEDPGGPGTVVPTPTAAAAGLALLGLAGLPRRR